jgi:hypothetical protein
MRLGLEMNSSDAKATLSQANAVSIILIKDHHKYENS